MVRRRDAVEIPAGGERPGVDGEQVLPWKLQQGFVDDKGGVCARNQERRHRLAACILDGLEPFFVITRDEKCRKCAVYTIPMWLARPCLRQDDVFSLIFSEYFLLSTEMSRSRCYGRRRAW